MNNIYHVLNNENFVVDEKLGHQLTLLIDAENSFVDYRLTSGVWHIFVYHRSNDVKLEETFKLERDCEVHITYFDIENSNFKQNSTYSLAKGATLDVKTIYLARNSKDITFDITNHEGMSRVDIDNSVVALKDADFNMNVIGNVVKGAKGSIHHQKNRCLTIDKLNKALIRPILNIDENDVEASHAMSSGTIDENILYYMNSRGLNRHEALVLMVAGYLTLNEQFYKDYQIIDEIKAEIEGKGSELCLM